MVGKRCVLWHGLRHAVADEQTWRRAPQRQGCLRCIAAPIGSVPPVHSLVAQHQAAQIIPGLEHNSTGAHLSVPVVTAGGKVLHVGWKVVLRVFMQYMHVCKISLLTCQHWRRRSNWGAPHSIVQVLVAAQHMSITPQLAQSHLHTRTSDTRAMGARQRICLPGQTRLRTYNTQGVQSRPYSTQGG